MPSGISKSGESYPVVYAEMSAHYTKQIRFLAGQVEAGFWLCYRDTDPARLTRLTVSDAETWKEFENFQRKDYWARRKAGS